MTNNTILSLEEIEAKTQWVAKMQGYRMTGTYEELKSYREDEECRDFDICCEQPEELKDFYDKYFAYNEKHGWITIPEFYNTVYAVQYQPKEISTADFDKLVGLCSYYDPFTQYIDDYASMISAERCNDQIIVEFNKIMQKFDIEVSMVPTCNRPIDEIREELTKWLKWKSNIAVAEPEEQNHKSSTKRVWTEEEIKSLVQTNDKVLYGALKNLYACQTADEQCDFNTKHQNGAGFNALDAEFLTCVAQFLEKHGFLTDKQKLITRKKLVKYNKQLTRLANA